MTFSFKSLSLATAVLAASLTAHADPFTVEIGKTKALKLKAEAASVAIGNPNVADIAVHDSNLMFVSGKTFGTTNLLIMDSDGKTIYSSDIVVTANTANLVTVNRAGADYTYDCAPTCRAGLAVGDAEDHYNKVFAQISQQKDLSE